MYYTILSSLTNDKTVDPYKCSELRHIVNKWINFGIWLETEQSPEKLRKIMLWNKGEYYIEINHWFVESIESNIFSGIHEFGYRFVVS